MFVRVESYKDLNGMHHACLYFPIIVKKMAQVIGTYCLCRGLVSQLPLLGVLTNCSWGSGIYLLDSKTAHSCAHYHPQLNSLAPKEQFIKSWEQLAMCACTLELVGRDRQTLRVTVNFWFNDRTYLNE